MFESSITIKGQTTLPKPVRDLLEVKPGDKVRLTRKFLKAIHRSTSAHSVPRSTTRLCDIKPIRVQSSQLT